MKKVFLFTAAILFLLTPTVWANYALNAKKDVEGTLQRFFNEERGNRLSTFSMRGLMQEIDRAFMENIKRPEPIKKEK